VVVFTDGNDTASRLTPSEVSGIASSIDVPVYILGVVPSIDNPTAETATATAARSPLAGGLSDLARWTGGRLFIASTPAERSSAARQIIEELRHQYLIAFESSGKPGWHPLEVRTRVKDLTVRARSGYIAGQSRPVSH
jgi:VWFA-related protein